MSTASFSTSSRANALPILRWIAVATIVIAFALPFFVPIPFLYTIPLGVVGVACSFLFMSRRAKVGLIAGNIAAMISPLLVLFIVTSFLWIASIVTGGRWPPPDYG